MFYTEFVSCEGLVSPGREKLLKDFYFTEDERPIVAQIFGSRPEHFYECGKLIKELGFNGIDVNMGCPDRAVLKQKAGAALCDDPKLALEILKQTKRGAGEMPLSVKARLGNRTENFKEFLPYILETQPAALIVHLRTAKEMSKVPAKWDRMAEIVPLVKKHSPDTLVIGNGDVITHVDALAKANEYGLDGIMIGRGIFENPWFFDPAVDPAEKTPNERLELLKEHVRLFTELWGPTQNSGQPPTPGAMASRRWLKSFDLMKKFFKVYISGWPGAKELRTELMKTKNEKDVLSLLTGKKILPDYENSI